MDVVTSAADQSMGLSTEASIIGAFLIFNALLALESPSGAQWGTLEGGLHHLLFDGAQLV